MRFSVFETIHFIKAGELSTVEGQKSALPLQNDEVERRLEMDPDPVETAPARYPTAGQPARYRKASFRLSRLPKPASNGKKC
jgi:hypothetical protein